MKTWHQSIFAFGGPSATTSVMSEARNTAIATVGITLAKQPCSNLMSMLHAKLPSADTIDAAAVVASCIHLAR